MNKDFDGFRRCGGDGGCGRDVLMLSRTLLGGAADEEWMHELDPKHADGAAYAMEELVPETLATMVDFAPALTRLLSRAQVVAQRNAVDVAPVASS